jgi:hypothetical protein
MRGIHIIIIIPISKLDSLTSDNSCWVCVTAIFLLHLTNIVWEWKQPSRTAFSTVFKLEGNAYGSTRCLELRQLNNALQMDFVLPL